MDNNTDKLIQDQFNTLPQDVKEAISRVPWKDRILDIGKREKLGTAQIDALETETMLILYGFVSHDKYPSNLVTEVGLSDEQTERIVKLVMDEIVADIEKQFEMIEALNPKSEQASKSDEKPRLEIPPEILAKQIKMPSEPVDKLPEVIPGEVAHDVPHVDTPAAPTPILAATPVTVPEPVKTAPSSDVPITAVPMSTAPKSIMGEKLSEVTVAPVHDAPATPKPLAYTPGKDPYREPVE